MKMTLREELYENAKRCYELLSDKCVGTYATINDTDYDEVMLLLDEIICGLSADKNEVFWK